MYLLDTDVVTNPLKPQPSPALLARLAGITAGQQHISTITLGEIVYGAHRSTRPSYHLERLDRLILSQVRVLTFDEDAARCYGRVRAELERRGEPIAHADLQIAAIALSRGLILITGNRRHFERVPSLAVEDWFADPRT
ncbi:MAG: PIN domain-containing protein [Armatimonadetes bacterium]|nr:PIN domain-containing protein [Armatimonadota bacterium]